MKNKIFFFRSSYDFRSGGDKSTTNVAWLVGAATGPIDDSQHHIDIVTPDKILPPPYLAVTPLQVKTPAQPPLQPPAYNSPPKVTTTLPKMGYSLCRSKTVSDIPCWTGDNVNNDTSDHKVTKVNRVKQRQVVRRNMSSVSVMSETMGSTGDMSTMTVTSDTMSTLGTVSTTGSTRSRIVRHKTLLGSSSRLYKFSQSMSSLNTITSAESRGSTLR